MSTILFTRFPLESAHGGAERQTMMVMEGLRKRGHNIQFVGSCPVLLHLCREHQIPSLELHIGPPPVTKWGAVNFAWRRRKMQRSLRGVLEGIPSVDAVVMLSLSEKLLLTSEAAARGARVFWLEHDSVGRWLSWNPWLPRLRKLSNRATSIVVSELSRSLHLRLGWQSDRIVTIPNGIDLTRFGAVSPPLPHADSRLRLGCVSRLAYEKGIDLLMEAVRRIPPVTLEIVGTGPEKQWLHAMAVQEPRIRFREHIHSLMEFYGTIDALVLPSRTHDPFGLVAAEAMACGLPVVVTDACGIAHQLHHDQDSIVVRAGSTEALQEGITLLQDQGRRERIGRAGKEEAWRAFSAETMIDRYEAVLTQ